MSTKPGQLQPPAAERRPPPTRPGATAPRDARPPPVTRRGRSPGCAPPGYQDVHGSTIVEHRAGTDEPAPDTGVVAGARQVSHHQRQRVQADGDGVRGRPGAGPVAAQAHRGDPQQAGEEAGAERRGTAGRRSAPRARRGRHVPLDRRRRPAVSTTRGTAGPTRSTSTGSPVALAPSPTSGCNCERLRGTGRPARSRRTGPARRRGAAGSSAPRAGRHPPRNTRPPPTQPATAPRDATPPPP